MTTLHYDTVSDNLKNYLLRLMSDCTFNCFRLVGGTALSLQLGHRVSIDIDLFTDIEYGTMDTDEISKALQRLFSYIEGLESLKQSSLGYTLRVGDSKDSCIKLDLFYTAEFLFPEEVVDGIRLASLQEIGAMKMSAITTRKEMKDFWDINELIQRYRITDLIKWGIDRDPYVLTKKLILESFGKIDEVDPDVPLKCLKGNYWEFVKEDLLEAINSIC
ncbi:MAG: nucleotidyl transferase AbiEii/AbiGii toxin family protein [Tannerellaceae bacterium]|nr:nucleotidyl transferase AbiEii/AbiGii toxin family protein [Tannerellaceae bacterium]